MSSSRTLKALTMVKSAAIAQRSKCNTALSTSRDSPHNPFLISSSGSCEEVAVKECDIVPSFQEEKPTMLVVFRGIRYSMPNPYYNMPSAINPNSLLPVEHPDYEWDECVVPRRLLFGVAWGRGIAEAEQPGTSADRVPVR
ncbi:hypothetical protein B0H10DRAFT_1948418 [Mycena sp. CBHHK59/15]|nr:hypothetical protein B0H10DRAFT_1948418 [Mycena sp. CBHHK59/15]